MDVVFIAAAACFLLLGIAFGVLVVRLISRDRIDGVSDHVSGEIFSPGRYRAIERLLDQTDQNFLHSQSGWNRRMEKNFRKARIKICRGYLRQLSDDFNKICKAIKLLMVTSEIDRPDLAGVLMKQQFRFALGMGLVEFKLTLYGLGWRGVSVDVKHVLGSLDTMRAQLQSLAEIAQPAEVYSRI
jgi:hypothetical protein